MTYAASETGVLAPTVEATPPGAIRRLVGSVYRAMDKGRRRRALQELPDYLLKDIGISRCDIAAVVDAIVDGRDDPTRSHPLRGR